MTGYNGAGLSKEEEWGLKFELEVGAVKPWGVTAEKTFSIQQPKWGRVLRLGGTINGIAMDEPLCCCREHIHKPDDYALEQTAAFIALVRKHYPQMAISEIETYPTISLADHMKWIESLEKRLGELGVRGLDAYSVSPPHAPCVAPAPFYDMYDPAKLILPTTWSERRSDWSKTLSGRLAGIYGEEGVREWVRCYYAQVSMMDWCFGRILNALDDLGLADRTLVVFTSDHGTLLGQHGMIDKAVEAFYDDLMRVPLIMRLPRTIPAGKICPAYGTSVDVAPTILDYLAMPPLTETHGRSLQPFLEGKIEDDRPVFGERGRLDKPHAARVIRTPQWKLNFLSRGEMELYDLRQDPDELQNLAHDPAQAQRIRELSSQLLEHMRTVGDQGRS